MKAPAAFGIIVALFVGIPTAAGFCLWLGWNHGPVPAFGLPRLSFWQAVWTAFMVMGLVRLVKVGWSGPFDGGSK